MMHLNPPMEKEAPEEIGNRKTGAPKNIRKENNRFVSFLVGKRFPRRSTPMDHAAGLKKMLSHQIQKIGVGTLTRLPSVDLRFENLPSSDQFEQLEQRQQQLEQRFDTFSTVFTGFSDHFYSVFPAPVPPPEFYPHQPFYPPPPPPP